MGSDCVAVQIEMARHHLGVGVFPCFMADAFPDLKRVLRAELDVPVELWVLMNPDLKANRGVREVYDFLIATAKADAPALTGRREAAE